MKLLAKSIVKEDQIEARKDLCKEGIEFLLLGPDVEGKNIGNTLLRIVDANEKYHYPVIGLEAPDSNGPECNIDPISRDSYIQRNSREFLARCVTLSNEVALWTKAKVYFQYQCLFDKYPQVNWPPKIDLEQALDALQEFHHGLQRNSDIQLQMENAIPVDPAYSGSSMHHCFVTTRPSDFERMNIPMAFDVVHYAQSVYVWSKAEPASRDFFAIDADGKKYCLQMTDEDKEIGRSILGKDLKTAMTAEIIRVLEKHKSRIGSLQFSDTKIGFGTLQDEAGYDGEYGMIDVPKVIECARHTRIPYAIPEYKETNYNNPIIQRKIFKELQR